ncbi:MAG: hypothetical protein LBC44_03095 [Mycoplasmataceae bacterium]|jgi:hypothetical protein|nr:hypothetical protein [Mycoplasmataceae bacterium]
MSNKMRIQKAADKALFIDKKFKVDKNGNVELNLELEVPVNFVQKLGSGEGEVTVVSFPKDKISDYLVETEDKKERGKK